jgi:prepilin-type N-terminal cleavage/methylation domain-containing protein/prepilin-type processing-associated H-X9-DG protein
MSFLGLRRRGFSLIELLVVIAIIGILAAFLFPVLGRGKAAAASAQCKSNLRQMGLALALYVHDQDGLYPHPGGGTATERGFDSNWHWEISRYLHGREAYRSSTNGVRACPTYKHEKGTLYLGLTGLPLSYGYNGLGTYVSPDSEPVGLGGISMGYTPEGKRWYIHTRESIIKDPANMLAMGDGYTSGPTPPTLYESDQIRRSDYVFENYRGLQMRDIQKRHGGMLNMIFCDGHVEGGRIHSWYFSQDEKDVRRWNARNIAGPAN